MKKFYILFSLLIFSIFSLSAIEERRCAVDIGSGYLKMQAALIDTDQNEIIKVLNEPFLFYTALANYFEQDGELNENIQKVVSDAFKQILAICVDKKIQKMGGVATEIFRKAGSSGVSLFNKIKEMANAQFGEENVNLQIVSQDLESELGFLTAVSLSPEIAINDLISWDSGNASCQLVMKDHSKLNVYNMPIGTAVATKLFVEKIRDQHYEKGMNLLPISSQEVYALVNLIDEKIDVSDSFIENKGERTVIGIGGPPSLFSIASKAIGKDTFTIDELHSIVYSFIDLKPDAKEIVNLDPIEPETVIIRLILIYAMMEKLGINQITYKASTGTTRGIFLDKSFWGK